MKPKGIEVELATSAMLSRIRHTIGAVGDQFPHWADTSNGDWTATADGDWTGGAWVGELWLAARVTGDLDFVKAATQWRGRMETRVLLDTAFKGFGFYHAAAMGHLLCGDVDARDMALRCATHLASMYDQKLGLIPLGKGAEEGQNVGVAESSIDSLQASPLLAWAAIETDDEAMLEVAIRHTSRVLDIHLRHDGSVIQSSSLDPRSGEVVRYHTHKGYSDDSTWGRAQGWAILYASAMSLALPAHDIWLTQAKTVADWWIDHVPADGVTFWDFDDPGIPNAPRDTAATAIVAAGLLRLARALGPEEGRRYQEAAEKSIKTLTDEHLTPTSPDDERPVGILTHGCFTKRPDTRPQDKATDVELIFGSYFLFECLAVLAGDVDLGEFMPAVGKPGGRP